MSENFAETKPGDVVALCQGRWGEYIWQRLTIEKVTATQITAGGRRFNRRNGIEIGDARSWHKAEIHPMDAGRERQIAEYEAGVRRKLLSAWIEQKLALLALPDLEAISVEIEKRLLREADSEPKEEV